MNILQASKYEYATRELLNNWGFEEPFTREAFAKWAWENENIKSLVRTVSKNVNCSRFKTPNEKQPIYNLITSIEKTAISRQYMDNGNEPYKVARYCNKSILVVLTLEMFECVNPVIEDERLHIISRRVAYKHYVEIRIEQALKSESREITIGGRTTPLQSMYETLAKLEALEDQATAMSNSEAKRIARQRGNYPQLISIEQKAQQLFSRTINGAGSSK